MESMHSEKGIQRQKKQEQRVQRLLLSMSVKEFEGPKDVCPPVWHFRREHKIDFRCVENHEHHHAKIDFVLTVPTGLIFLEVDERQHRYGYTVACDMKRMSNVMESLTMDGNIMSVLWLRYNPDCFSVDGVPQKCKKTDREEWLKKRILSYGKGQNEHKQMLHIEYAYYDKHDKVLNVLYDPEYHPLYKSVVSSNH